MMILTDAAKYYKEQDHQDIAWDWLQDNIPIDVLDTFGDMYRAAPPEEEKPKDVTELVSKYQLAGIWNCAESLIEDREIVELNSCLWIGTLFILFVLNIFLAKQLMSLEVENTRKNFLMAGTSKGVLTSEIRSQAMAPSSKVGATSS